MPAVAMKRQAQVQNVIADWHGTFMTLTIGSYKRDKLADLVADLIDIWKGIGIRWGQRAGGKGKKCIRALEVTFNLQDFTWHPHLHVLVKDATPEDLAWIPGAWVDLANKRKVKRYAAEAQQVLKPFRGDDLVYSKRQGCMVRMSEYLAKEQTLGPMKQGVDDVTGGVSPFYFLERAALGGRGSRMGRERWAEYEAAMRGRRWMVFSNGLLNQIDDTDDLSEDGGEVETTSLVAFVREDSARLLTVDERARLVEAARCDPTPEGFAAAKGRVLSIIGQLPNFQY